MADSQKQTIVSIQKDVGTLRTDMAVVKTKLDQTQKDVGEINSGMKAIMEGYVPTAIYLKDREADERRYKDLETEMAAVRALSEANTKTLQDSKPALDLGNSIVRKLIQLAAGGAVVGAVLYFASQQGGVGK